MRSVVAAAANLDAVVQGLDARTAESGLVNPVVRKAVGQVYCDKGQFLPAVSQTPGRPEHSRTTPRR